MIDCFVSNKFNTNFECLCNIVINLCYLLFLFALVAFLSFLTLVGKSSDCDAAAERSTG